MNTTTSTSLLIGQRSTPNRGTGIGLTTLTQDESDTPSAPAWRISNELPAVNPGAQVLHPSGRWLYVAHGDTSDVSTYRVTGDPANPLELLSTQNTGGKNPAHLCLSPDADAIMVANHSTGSLAVLPIDDNGELLPLSQLLTLKGTPGPHESDQPGPKPHQVVFSPDGAWLAVPDKGLDAVHWCTFDRDRRRLAVQHSVKLREISGPRHIAFHPTMPCAYVVNELDNTVVTLDTSPLPTEPARAVQVLPAPPSFDVRDTRAAEILVHPSGTNVYVSNRSGAGDSTPGGPENDWITSFQVTADGTLQVDQHVSSKGIRPRFMRLSHDSSALLVANERSGTIVSIPVEKEGSLADSFVIAEVASPVHILDIRNPADRAR